MKRYIILVCLFLGGLSGCDDFLEEQSNENAYATSCRDLNELLVGGGYMQHLVVTEKTQLKPDAKNSAYFPWLHVMDDDAEEFVRGEFKTTTPLAELYGFYSWEKDPCNLDGVLYSDKTWGRLYEHIAVLNVILDKVENFTHDTEEDRSAVKGQCYFLRASYYYLLVNLYAKPYDQVTASRDLGVPIKLTPYVEDKNYTRASVDSVYHQIVSDLILAIDYLEGYQPTTLRRATQNAARVLLSRVYCYMGKWDLVPTLCNAVLAENKYSFKNLTKTTTKDTSWIDVNSPEIIFTQGSHCINRVFPLVKGQAMSGFRISDELIQLFDENGFHEKTLDGLVVREANDYRKKFTLYQEQVPTSEGEVDFFIPRKTRALTTAEEFSFVSDVFTIRISEVYLNLAEALVMTNQEGLARDVLKTLMENRISNLEPITVAGKDLIDLVRKERRRELCFEGQRWFDLRRYAVSPNYPELNSIRHKTYDYAYGGSGTPGIYKGYYVLPDYPDGGWVLPIPSVEIEQTDGAIVNNNRESCVLHEN